MLTASYLPTSAASEASRVHALVGADRQRPRHVQQRIVAIGGQRLLDQRNAGLCAGGEIAGEIVRRPAFVGVDDQLGPWCGIAHRKNSRAIVRSAAELDLEQRTIGGLGGGLRHRIRRCERDRIGGGERLRHGKPYELVHRPLGALGGQVPERAVDRVARRAGRHRGLQALAIESLGDRAGELLDCGRDALDRLAVARIGHAFAAAPMHAVGELGDHDHGFGLGAAADREGACDRPAFDTDREGERRRVHLRQ